MYNTNRGVCYWELLVDLQLASQASPFEKKNLGLLSSPCAQLITINCSYYLLHIISIIIFINFFMHSIYYNYSTY